MATHGYIQVPPDGAGKKIHTIQHVEEGETVHSQMIHVHDHDIPTQVWQIDNKGSGKITFAEGPPSLDAFGNLRVSNSTLLGSYMFANGTLDELFTQTTTNGGLIQHDEMWSMKRMSTSADPASSTYVITDHYHNYQAGTGQLIILTVVLSDNGITNNVRKWGYYESENGLYWELDGTTLGVEIRHTLGGITDCTPIPRSEWNGDKVDGTGLSGFILDLTKANFYWIDFAWLGVGNVRFGVLGTDGQRIVCHTFKNPNSNPGPYMGFATLPLCFENFNEGAVATGTELGIICAAVYAEGFLNPMYRRYDDIHSSMTTVVDDTPLLHLRANVKYAPANLVWNLGETYLQTLAVYCSAPMKLELIHSSVVSGIVWDQPGLSSLEGGTGGTSLSGQPFASWYLNSGCTMVDMGNYYEAATGMGIHVDANNEQPVWSFTATPLLGLATHETIQATMRATYKELI